LTLVKSKSEVVHYAVDWQKPNIEFNDVAKFNTLTKYCVLNE